MQVALGISLISEWDFTSPQQALFTSLSYTFFLCVISAHVNLFFFFVRGEGIDQYFPLHNGFLEFSHVSKVFSVLLSSKYLQA